MQEKDSSAEKSVEVNLVKKNSSRKIEIVTNQEDDWFLHVNTVKKSSGEILHTSMIIRKDLESWVRYLESNGWIKQNNSMSSQ